MNTENLTKANHEADYMLSDLRYAHSDAIRAGNGFAEIILLDLIKEAASLAEKIKRAREAAMAVKV